MKIQWFHHLFPPLMVVIKNTKLYDPESYGSISIMSTSYGQGKYRQLKRCRKYDQVQLHVNFSKNIPLPISHRYIFNVFIKIQCAGFEKCKSRGVRGVDNTK
jgi:hypothetical protein